MLVVKGELVRSKGQTDRGLDIPSLCYKVARTNATFSGEGVDKGSSVVVDGAEWSVDSEPTAESKARFEGFWARVDAVRAALPGDASVDFADGWKDADRQIKKLDAATRKLVRQDASAARVARELTRV